MSKHTREPDLVVHDWWHDMFTLEIRLIIWKYIDNLMVQDAIACCSKIDYWQSIIWRHPNGRSTYRECELHRLVNESNWTETPLLPGIVKRAFVNGYGDIVKSYLRKCRKDKLLPWMAVNVMYLTLPGMIDCLVYFCEKLLHDVGSNPRDFLKRNIHQYSYILLASVDTMKYLTQCHDVPAPTKILSRHLKDPEMIDFLCHVGAKWTLGSIIVAVENQRHEYVKMAFQTQDSGLGHHEFVDIIVTAVRRDDLKMVKYLCGLSMCDHVDMGALLDCSLSITTHLSIARYLHVDRNVAWTETSLSAAACNSNVSFLQYVHTNGAPCSNATKALEAAIFHKREDNIEFLIRHYGATIDYGNLHTISSVQMKMLTQVGVQWDSHAICNAIRRRKDLEAIQCMYEDGAPWCASVIKKAATHDNLHILKYVITHGAPLGKWRKALSSAIYHLNYDSAAYLVACTGIDRHELVKYYMSATNNGKFFEDNIGAIMFYAERFKKEDPALKSIRI